MFKNDEPYSEDPHTIELRKNPSNNYYYYYNEDQSESDLQ